MKKLYIVTGANGHLGGVIIRLLKKAGETVRGLILPSEQAEDCGLVRYYHGDVRDKASLEPLFADTEEQEVIVIHTAGIIDISAKASAAMAAVNVGGTRNVAELCLAHKVRRLVYVSSGARHPRKGRPAGAGRSGSFLPRRRCRRLRQDQSRGHPDRAGTPSNADWTPWWCIPPASSGPTIGRATTSCSW